MIAQLLFGLVFGGLTFYIGWRMVSIRSYRQALEAYEKNPAAADWFVKYFLGYVFPMQRAMHRSMMNGMGDGVVSGFFRLSGVFFMLVGVAALAGFVFLAYMTQTGA